MTGNYARFTRVIEAEDTALKNLTPVTLELGGKSPAVIGPDHPMQKAIERILFARLFNAGQHDLPFGGVGASGMGHYHFYVGFATFSKLRPVFYQARFSALKFLAPPYRKLANTMLNLILKIKK